MHNETQKGILLKGVGGLYEVRLLSLKQEMPHVQCRARGVFKHRGIEPLPGDTVTVLEAAEDETSGGGYVIDEIGARKNQFIRPALANLDMLFVVIPAAKPAPVLFTADKLIAIAEFNHAEPVILITKTDLAPDRAGEIAAVYRSSGFRVFCVSSHTGEGVAELESFIEETFTHDKAPVAAFSGASGAGKSTLLNALFPALSLETKEISRKIERGRHTTRTVSLYPMDEVSGKAHLGGYIADTPGFSVIDFERFDFFTKDDLPYVFREFAPEIGNCRYTKCSHTKEEGCAMLALVHEGRISPSRHESYVQLYETLKQKPSWEKTDKTKS